MPAIGAAVREGAHEDVHAVRAFEGGQAEVRDDEPLRCARAVISPRRPGAVLRPRRHDVDAGFELAHGLQDGESGDDVFVQIGLASSVPFQMRVPFSLWMLSAE